MSGENALRHNRSRIRDRASQATRVLEQAWEMLRAVIPDLPTAVVLLISSVGRRRAAGVFAHSTWRYRSDTRAHEVAFSPALFEDPTHLLATMVHEAVHAQIWHRTGDFSGCSPDGLYHRREFRDACSRAGLECTFRNRSYGWSTTKWPGPKGNLVPAQYDGILAFLRQNLPWGTAWQTGGTHRASARSTRSHIKLSCGCGRRNIFVCRSVAEKGGIWCSFCNSEFRPQGAERNEDLDA